MDEKKNIKSLNKKLFIMLIIICAILGTIFAIRAIAATITTTVDTNTGEVQISVSNAGLSDEYYWDLTDLQSNWYIVCCAHHQPLGSNHEDADGKTGDFTFTLGSTSVTLDSETESSWSTTKNTTGSTESFDQDSYTVIWWKYTAEGTYIANPAEAYLLSVASTKGTGSYPSSFQQAWWNTSIGGTGASGGSSALWTAASNFQTYISSIINANDTAQNGGAQAYYNANSSKYKQYTINGVTVTAPDLETYYNPIVRYYLPNESIDSNSSEEDIERADVDQENGVTESDRLTVEFEEETNAYIVGPFSLDYYEDGSEVSESVSEYESLLSYAKSLYNWLNNGAGGFTTKVNSYITKVRTYNTLSTGDKEQLKTDLEEFITDTNTVFTNMGVYMEFSSLYTDLDTLNDLLDHFETNVTNGEIVSALETISTDFTSVSTDLLAYLESYIAELEDYIEEIKNDTSSTTDESGSASRVVYDESFSYISGATLTTNLGSATLDETTGWGVSSDGSFKWTFRWVDGERDSDDTYIYPHDDEVFYIQIEYNGEGLLTSIDGLDFEFTYMNAGGSFKRYSGTKNTDVWTSDVEATTYYYKVWEYAVDDEGNYTNTLGSYLGEKSYSSAKSDTTRYHYVLQSIDYSYSLTKSSHSSENDAQMLGIVINGVRWYNTKTVSISWKDDTDKTTDIKIMKTTVDENGDAVYVDSSYTFEVYVDYTGSLTSVSAWKNLSDDELSEKHFETVVVKVTNGYGENTTSEIVWEYDEDSETYIQPTYYVVEREDSTVSSVSGVPKAGYCEANTTIEVGVENTLEPHKGTLDLEKVIQNDPDNILENQEFSFTITIKGDFIYNGVSYTELTKEFTVTGAQTLTLEDIMGEGDGYVYWYGSASDAPTYEIKENVSENAFYENTHKYNYKGTFKCSCDECGNESDVISDIQFINEAGTYAQLEVDKKLVSGTAPEVGEEFTIKVVIYAPEGGSFYYGDDFNNLEEFTDSKEIEIILTSDNDWTWASEKIWWTTSKAPTYTVEEIAMADHYEYVSITNGQKTTTNSVFTGTLTAGDVEKVTVTNDTTKIPVLATLKLNKITNKENDTTEFTFYVTIKGYFEGTINGTYYDYGYHEIENVEVRVTANAEAIVVAELEWYEDDYEDATIKAPTYTVEEVDIPSNYEFVSISNGTSTVTNVQSISGNFASDDSVLVTCINNYDDTEPDSGVIQINKEVLGVDSIPDDLEVTVELTITANTNSTFQYGGSSYDTSSSAVNYSTYVFSDDTDNNQSAIILNKANNWSWSSDNIWWDTNTSTAPYYEVTEVSWNLDYCEFEYIVTPNSTVTTSSTGLIQLKQGSINAVEIVNSIEKPVSGKIEVNKVSKNDSAVIVTGEEFNFMLEVTGKFTYNYTEDDGTINEIKIDGTLYFTDEGGTNEEKGTDSDGNTIYSAYYLSGINVIADSDSWISELFTWYESDGTPTYQIRENLTEEQESAGITFEGMYSSSNTKTSNVQDWLAGDLVGSEDESNPGVAYVTGQNGSETHKGRIEITKLLVDENGNEIDSNMTFDITITVTLGESVWTINKTMSAGETYRTDYFEWAGDTAPTYTVTEATGNYTTSISNGSGQLVCELCDKFGSSQSPVKVTITNTMTKHEGYLQVTKKVTSDDKVSTNDSSEIADTTFEINVTITSNSTFWYKGTEYSYLNLTIYLKDGETWGYDGTEYGNGYVYWYGDVAPTFSVSEDDVAWGYSLRGIVYSDNFDEETGNIIENTTVSATVTNKWYTNTKIYLTMEMGGKVWDDTDYSVEKRADSGENGVIDEDEAGIEGVKVTVSRALVTADGELVKKLSGVYAYDANYKLITYGEAYGDYNVTVDEYGNYEIYTYTDQDGNWSIDRISVAALVGDEASYTYNGKTYEELLQANSDGTYNYRVAYYVTFSYDGQTYEPTTYLATSNTNAASDTSTIKTLANTYSALKVSEKDDYLLNSMAIDLYSSNANNYSSLKDYFTTRVAFNNKFETIAGDTAMDSNGDTTGKAISTDGSTTTLKYTSESSISTTNSDNTKKVSTLSTTAESYGETTESNNQVYSALQIDASTIAAYLAYPCENNISLSDTTWEKQWLTYNDSSSGEYTVDDDGNVVGSLVTVNRSYHAIYNYLNSINLGLIKREATDVATDKDLTEMIVVINGKVLTYTYSSLIDFESETYKDALLQQLAVADADVTYTLGIYSSDYYYRASIYEGSEAGDALSTLLQTKGLSLSSLDLEVYLKYTITVYNESETYDVSIGSLYDYHDDSLVLMTDMAETTTYVSTINGEEVNDWVTLDDMISGYLYKKGDGLGTANSTVVYYDANGNVEEADQLTSVNWSQDATAISGSDGVTYNMMTTTSLAGRKISAGGKAKIQLTYKIDKETASVNGYSIEDSLILGTKHNIVEIGSFTSYTSNSSKMKWGEANEKVAGRLTGRVDEDSAPNNVNITELNEINYYEDDTTEAPMAYVTLVDDDREINGLVWEDAETDTVAYSQTIGNGLYNLDEGDRLIEGMTTQLVEVISIPTDETDSDGNTIYEEYDFVWDTDAEYDFLGGSSLSTLTGLNSTTSTDNMGEYTFSGVAAGNYKVRFVYGDTKVLTGNDDYEVVYNGQDYKSTTYQAGYTSTTDSDSNGYTDNAWQDLSDSSLEAARVSDARDSEARRLYITSKSEMLTYDNTSVLALADEDLSEDEYAELFGTYSVDNSDTNSIVTADGYYMYAETAKISLEIENVSDLDYVDENTSGINVTVGTSVLQGTTVTNYKYTVDNIDFGLEERSQTKLTLDKQIKEITITSSDNQVILDAVYDIIYEMTSDGTINVTVSLNEVTSDGYYSNLASLNRSGSNQGYRYIALDTTILQGTTLTVKYQLTVFNVSEADTSSTALTAIWDADDPEAALNSALEELTSNRYTTTYRLAYNPDTGIYGGTYEYGKYVGSIYYLGMYGTYFTDTADTYGNYTELAKTTVHQIVDYVDPDVEFVASENIAENQSWSTTTIDYLVTNRLVDPDAVILIKDGLPVYEEVDGEIVIKTYADILNGTIGTDEYDSYTILNDELQQYITDSKSNVILNIDSSGETTEDGETITAGTNPELVKETVPYTAYYEYDADYAYDAGVVISTDEYDESNETEYAYDRATAQITLEVSRYYSSEEDGQDIDNIAEIIKVENTVGRRDARNVAGNTITYQIDQEEASEYSDPEYILTSTKSLYEIAGEEPDTSATEVITLSPPTGLSTVQSRTMAILLICLAAAVVALVGVIIIKKKVLLKK